MLDGLALEIGHTTIAAVLVLLWFGGAMVVGEYLKFQGKKTLGNIVEYIWFFGPMVAIWLLFAVD